MRNGPRRAGRPAPRGTGRANRCDGSGQADHGGALWRRLSRCGVRRQKTTPTSQREPRVCAHRRWPMVFANDQKTNKQTKRHKRCDRHGGHSRTKPPSGVPLPGRQGPAHRGRGPPPRCRLTVRGRPRGQGRPARRPPPAPPPGAGSAPRRATAPCPPPFSSQATTGQAGWSKRLTRRGSPTHPPPGALTHFAPKMAQNRGKC